MRPTCLITGAGGRLGQALCLALTGEYDIVATYRRSVPKVPSQLQRPVSPGVQPSGSDLRTGEIYCVQADLTCREDVRRVVEVALARYGHIDAIINSAADIKFYGNLLELWQSDDYALSQLSINCVAPLQLVSAVFGSSWKDQPEENARMNRSVVNVSSVSGLCVYQNTGQAFYSASKAAMNILTLHLSSELAPYSVRANAICPARLTDPGATNRVVDAIRRLLAGTDNGNVQTGVP